MEFYTKITAKKSKEQAEFIFEQKGIDHKDVIFDASTIQKQSGSVYSKLKERLIENHDDLTIDTLTSLGKNCREIYKELSYLWDNGVRVYVLDLDFTLKKKTDPMVALEETFKVLSDIEKSNVKVAQKNGIDRYLGSNGNYGRQKISFPKDWEQNYKLWLDKEITATEFMKRCNLKKGTFYNMIKEYKRNNPEELSKRA